MTKHISQLAVFHSELPWSNPFKKHQINNSRLKRGGTGRIIAGLVSG